MESEFEVGKLYIIQPFAGPFFCSVLFLFTTQKVGGGAISTLCLGVKLLYLPQPWLNSTSGSSKCFMFASPLWVPYLAEKGPLLGILHALNSLLRPTDCN